MPEQRLARMRQSLQEGYQFGDAGKPEIRIRYLREWNIHIDPSPKRMDDWNDIDRGEH